ncbi:hypothetical protein [Chromobacterium haemolyticum]|uniref:hypothetical protein n=1 Tax=Chromobacterium haemolyticum TaxID=394935 RepID=UPI00244D1548|nr:hypothetical protein [Chromobacterium haemolyticum]MDH0342159.1 hypothetical protein [Chromobacterium haemolyticum]
MERYLLTIETPPAGYEISKVFSMVQYTKGIRISETGLREEDCQDALDVLASSVPAEANALIGIKMTSTTLATAKGAYLYLTYIGTPAIIREI